MSTDLNQQLENITSNFKIFSTNQGSNTLESKLEEILEQTYIRYVDFLVGYFRLTGFNKISMFLNDVEEVRILVGINVDKNIFNADTKAKEFIKIFSREQVEIFNNENDKNKNSNITSLVNLLQSKKLSIRVAPNNDNHSKLYILKDKKITDHRCAGAVIIGSSNLTHNGLSGNLEINTELSRPDEIDEASQIFNILWANAVALTFKDVAEKILPKLKGYVPVQPVLTPFQIYMKFLIEYFGKAIDFIHDDNIFVPEGFKKLSYQVEAVNDGLVKLQKHNGFFLSDVVGLGKTVVITMLLKKLERTLKKEVLIVIPPAVRSQWEDTLNDFSINNYTIVSLAALNKVDSSKYELVIVDESHKFKNSESKRYKQLHDICIDKKVILLSATPQNNTPKDLYNQISLFQNVKKPSIQNCTNLRTFFEAKERKYKEIINSEGTIDIEGLKIISEEIREHVLRHVMIRRTRFDIEYHTMYKDDIKKQNLSLPTVNEPIEHEYALEGDLAINFESTAVMIMHKLNYSRFNAFHFLTKEARQKYYPKESDNIFDFNPLAGLMKVLLIKRFESSFSAFKISIARHLFRYEVFIENFENNKVYLGKKASDILDYSEAEDGDYDEFVSKLIKTKKVKILEKNDFEEDFLEELKSDLRVFKALVASWKGIDADPKFDKFMDVVNNEQLEVNKTKKIVIFTESVDTLNYLKSKCKNKEKILFITSSNRDDMKTVIRENFDANYDVTKQKNDINIIITTDTLAEGINLHRSNVIYNYDIPWNATKLIQRIGRVNRIGTRAEFINIHNFKPASHIETLIKLSQKAFVKLQSSHTMIGEDNKIYSHEESTKSVNLFDEYKKESNEKDEELNYLAELRAFRKSDKKEFEFLKQVKEGLEIIRHSELVKSYMVVRINEDLSCLALDKDTIISLKFLEMAQVLKSNKEETSKNYDKESAKICTSRMTDYFEQMYKDKQQDKNEARVDDTNEQKALLYLDQWYQEDEIKDDVLDKAELIIQDGKDRFFADKVILLTSSTSKDDELRKLVSKIVIEEKVDISLKIELLLLETMQREIK